MASEALFVYGTLQYARIQRNLFGRVLESTPDRLDGYERNTDHAYPMAFPNPDDAIEGEILHLTAEELATVDIYEGSAYVRIQVKLASGTVAWVYCGHPTFTAKDI